MPELVRPNRAAAAPPQRRTPAGRRGLAKAARWLFALVSIALLLWFIDWRSSLTLLSRAGPGLVLLVLGLNVLRIALSAWKWQLLLAALDIRISLPAAVRIYWIGTFASSFLPSTVGGDVVRTVLSRRYGDIGPIAVSIVVERLTGLGVLLAFSLAAVLARPELLDHHLLWMLLVLASAGGTVGLLLACAFLLLRPQRIRVPPPHPDAGRAGSWRHRMLRVLAKVDEALFIYAGRPAALLGAVGISVLFYALVICNQYVIIRALGMTVDPLDVAAIAPLVMLIAALPVSLNGVGISEGAFVFFYIQVGLTPEEAFAGALLRRLTMTLMTLAGGLFWLAPSGDAGTPPPAGR